MSAFLEFCRCSSAAGDLDAKPLLAQCVLVDAGNAVAQFADIVGKMLRAETGVFKARANNRHHIRVRSELALEVEQTEHITHQIVVLPGIFICQQVAEIVQAQFDTRDATEDIRGVIGVEHEQTANGCLEKIQRVTTGFRYLVDQSSGLCHTGKGDGLLLQI